MNGRPCVLCSSTAFRFAVTGYDRMQARSDDFNYVRCVRCGLLTLARLPSPEQIPALYPGDYLSFINTWQRDLDKPVNRLAIKYLYGVDSVSRPRLARAIFRMLSGRIMPGIQEPYGANRLLDIGCGSGESLEVYRRLGWHVRGVEINQQAVAACREKGLDIHQGTVFDAPFGTQRFDLILLSHVIEHVLEPVAVLRRVAELLAPQGKIVITTPNTRGLGFLMYGSCWLHLDAPRHLFLFDANTIRLLSARAGLAVSRVVTQSSPQTLAESRHYSKTQGPRFPHTFAGRQALLRESARQRRPHRVYRDVVSPLAYFSSLFGKGDILEAELRAL
jgi:2-polyprenyl-3-methyl-5-hydroxy-6-metoxy-1,4-benzoquinol methylase